MRRYLLFMISFACIILGIYCGFAYYQFSQTELIQIRKRIEAFSPEKIAYNTIILSHDKKPLAYLGSKHRVYTPLHTLSPHTIQAFIAIEDSNFFQHSGISIRGILRALVVNLQHGRFVQGGSTITQQTARSFFLHKRKLVSRKLKEWIVARYFEKKFSKYQILEFYLNQMYFGLGAYGIGAASQVYFQKKASSLTLSESAYLAALLKAPSRLARRPELAKERQAVVLTRMHQTKMISAARLAKEKTHLIQPRHQLLSRLKTAPYFVDAAHYELKRYFDAKSLYQGMKIISSFDATWQKKLELAMQKKWHYLLHHASDTSAFRKEVQITGLTYDFRKQQILAIKGGQNYQKSQYNRALYTKRPMNNMIIPFLGLLLLAKGYTLDQFATPSALTLSEALHYKHLYLLAQKLQEFGVRSLVQLLSQISHQPKRLGLELLQGEEPVSAHMLARMFSYLITMSLPGPRSTLIKQVLSHDSHPQKKVFLSHHHQSEEPRGSKEKLSFKRWYLLKNLFGSTDCTLRFSSITSRGDDYWTLYISDRTISVIWIGSERGKITLPLLSEQQIQDYENLGQKLASTLCPQRKAHSL